MNSSFGKKWLRNVFRRRLFVITLIFVQIFFLVFFVFNTSREYSIVNWVLHSLSVLVCLYIIGKKEKPGYKLTWIFLILLFPIFGGIFYIFFFTQSTPKQLRRQMRESDELFRDLYLLPGNNLPPLENSRETCLPQVRYLQNHAGFPVYRHTRSEYYKSGEAYYKALLEELERAKKYIFLEFFILRPGTMLDSILSILERKVRDGLDVRLIYDDLGCFFSLPQNFKEQMESKGIKCKIFNPFKPILSSLQNNRDHRKIVSIDGKKAFTGGINLADEYINIFEKYGHWKDAAIKIDGEAAWSLTLIFLQMWNIGNEIQDDAASLYPWKNEPCTVMSDGYVQPYADSPIDDENVGEHVYVQIINNAKDYVYINTPYLIVDDNLLSALTLSAKSGVDVRIITPYRWDKKLVHITTRSYYRLLVKAGIKVYEYSDGFNHSKTFVSDDKVATVGTTNLDFRSLYLHFECGVWLYKSRMIKEVKEDFLATIPVCRQITAENSSSSAPMRIFQDALRLFAPLM